MWIVLSSAKSSSPLVLGHVCSSALSFSREADRGQDPLVSILTNSKLGMQHGATLSAVRIHYATTTGYLQNRCIRICTFLVCRLSPSCANDPALLPAQLPFGIETLSFPAWIHGRSVLNLTNSRYTTKTAEEKKKKNESSVIT